MRGRPHVFRVRLEAAASSLTILFLMPYLAIAIACAVLVGGFATALVFASIRQRARDQDVR